MMKFVIKNYLSNINLFTKINNWYVSSRGNYLETYYLGNYSQGDYISQPQQALKDP